MTDDAEVPGPSPIPTSPKFVHCKTGDAVVLTFGVDGKVEGVVTFASPNGRSLLVMMDAMVGGWAGGCPLTWREEADGFVPLGMCTVVTVARKEAHGG